MSTFKVGDRVLFSSFKEIGIWHPLRIAGFGIISRINGSQHYVTIKTLSDNRSRHTLEYWQRAEDAAYFAAEELMPFPMTYRQFVTSRF